MEYQGLYMYSLTIIQNCVEINHKLIINPTSRCAKKNDYKVIITSKPRHTLQNQV